MDSRPIANGAVGASPLSHASPYTLSGTDISGQMRKLEDIESEVIRMAIARYDGHMSEVARRLGIGRSTLYRKLKELGIESSEAETEVVVVAPDHHRQAAS
jgi:DNA-binding NtrC family response regulator